MIRKTSRWIWTVVSLSACLAGAAQAQGPGDLMYRVKDKIQSGVGACGLQVVEGNDSRLSQEIRNRGVEEVIVKPEGTHFAPGGVLIDFVVNSGSRSLDLLYSRAQNGELMLSMNRDFDVNDFSASVPKHGVVARTRIEVRPGLTVRHFEALGEHGLQEVNESAFVQFLDDDVAALFAKRVCCEAGLSRCD